MITIPKISQIRPIRRIALCLTFFIFHFSFCIQNSSASTLLFYWATGNSVGETNATTILTPTSAPQTNATSLISGSQFSRTNDYTGFAGFTNVAAGTYQVRLNSSTASTVFSILVPSDSNTYSNAFLATSGSIPNITAGYTRAQSDNRYALQTNANLFSPVQGGTITGTATNTGVNVFTGTFTNAANFQFDTNLLAANTQYANINQRAYLSLYLNLANTITTNAVFQLIVSNSPNVVVTNTVSGIIGVSNRPAFLADFINPGATYRLTNLTAAPATATVLQSHLVYQ